jgi:Fe-S-cluster containining protein
VGVSHEEAERIRGVRNRHGVADPFIRGPQGDLVLRHVEGACEFLEADGKCAIHAQLGFEAKPEACRRFPFFTTEGADGTRYVRASFACPTVVGCRGAGPEALAAALEREVPPAALPAMFRLGSAELPPELYERLEGVLAGLLAGRAKRVARASASPCTSPPEAPPLSAAADLPRAIAAAGALVARLVSASAGGADAVARALEEHGAPDALAALAADARPFRRPRDARILLAPFLLLSAPGEQSRVSRALHAVRLLLGRGRFRTWACARDVPLGALAGVRLDPAREAPGGLVRRYLVHLLRSRAFLVALPVEMQVNLVGVAYALVRWNARARAAIAGRLEVIEDDVTTAVEDTDREHFAHNLTELRILTSSWIGVWLSLMFQGPRRLAGLVLEARLDAQSSPGASCP